MNPLRCLLRRRLSKKYKENRRFRNIVYAIAEEQEKEKLAPKLNYVNIKMFYKY